MITMTEIARLTGVSQPTVSRVLNGNTSVNPGGAGKGAGLCQGTSFSAQCHGPQSGGQRHQADRRGTDGYFQLFFRGFGEIYGTGCQRKGLQPDIV